MLQSAEKLSVVSSRDSGPTALDSSDIKPKKLTFVGSQPFALLDSGSKNGSGLVEGGASGRFSLTLHACMTPRNEQVSIVSEAFEDFELDHEEIDEHEEGQLCASPEVMTFDVEIAENEVHRLDSRQS